MTLLSWSGTPKPVSLGLLLGQNWSLSLAFKSAGELNF